MRDREKISVLIGISLRIVPSATDITFEGVLCRMGGVEWGDCAFDIVFYELSWRPSREINLNKSSFAYHKTLDYDTYSKAITCVAALERLVLLSSSTSFHLKYVLDFPAVGSF